MCSVYNPAVIYDEGRFTLYERASGSLRPVAAATAVGLLESDDGVHFRHVSDKPVFTPEMAGSRYGSVQDPRVVKIDGTYYMTYAFRRFAWSIHPTGLGSPRRPEPLPRVAAVTTGTRPARASRCRRTACTGSTWPGRRPVAAATRPHRREWQNRGVVHKPHAPRGDNPLAAPFPRRCRGLVNHA